MFCGQTDSTPNNNMISPPVWEVNPQPVAIIVMCLHREERKNGIHRESHGQAEGAR